jgi:FdhE protein
LSRLTRDGWLDAHPYLRPVGELCARVERAAAGLDVETPGLPAWEDYAADFRKGVPLLRSADAAIDFEPGGRAARALIGKVAADLSDHDMASDASDLAESLRSRPDAARLVADWLLGDTTFDTAFPGLLRWLGWTAAARYLSPLVDAFGRWRDEEKWHRRHCPTCGSAPAMAQLVGVDPGRQRFLVCGCCDTRWRYRRTQCPFCEADAQRLSVVAVEGEGGLRIDHCESCKGYLKTYDGQGDEGVLLADWTSLHLDLLARDRGLVRTAASLYELPAEG